MPWNHMVTTDYRDVTLTYLSTLAENKIFRIPYLECW